jgi:hypothetical protein
MAALGEEGEGDGDALAVHPTVNTTAGLLGQYAMQLVAAQLHNTVIVPSLVLRAAEDPAISIIARILVNAVDPAAESSKCMVYAALRVQTKGQGM